MIPTYGFRMSVHAVDRLYERHSYLFAVPNASGKDRFDAAYRVLDDSVENKSVHNNTSFMMHVHESYGFDKKHLFFFNGDVIFIVVDDGTSKTVITTMSCQDSGVNHLRNVSTDKSTKFTKKAPQGKYKRYEKISGW